jgi:hypothetical protein
MASNYGMKAPKTLNEMSQTERDMKDADLLFLSVRFRAKRLPHNLPNAWDDKPRNVGRSWKHNRRTPYKNPEPCYKEELWLSLESA